METNATIIPRRALPNPHIPGFINGSLVWGVPPVLPASPLEAGSNASSNGSDTGDMAANGSAGDAMAGALVAAQGPAMEAVAPGPALPVGITCEATKGSQGQNCGWVLLPRQLKGARVCSCAGR